MYKFETDSKQPVKAVSEEVKLIQATFTSQAGRQLLELWKKGLIGRMTYNDNPQQAAYISGWSDAIRNIIKFAEAEANDE